MSTFEVGRQLRAARITAGLTMRELARRADLSHQLVEKVEGGQNTTVQTLEQLGAAMGAVVTIRIEMPRPSGPPIVLPPVDRLAVAGRLMAVLPSLPDVVVDGLIHDIALWEAQYAPDR